MERHAALLPTSYKLQQPLCSLAEGRYLRSDHGGCAAAHDAMVQMIDTLWFVCTSTRPKSPTAARIGKHPGQSQSQRPDLFQPIPLQGPRSCRAVLQQDKAVPSRRHPLRQARGELLRHRQARLHQAMAQVLWGHGPISARGFLTFKLPEEKKAPAVDGGGLCAD